MTWNWHLCTITLGKRVSLVFNMPLWPSQTMAKGICFKLLKNSVQLTAFSRSTNIHDTTWLGVPATRMVAFLSNPLPSMMITLSRISTFLGKGTTCQKGVNHEWRVCLEIPYCLVISSNDCLPSSHFPNNFCLYFWRKSTRFRVRLLPQKEQRNLAEPLRFLPHFCMGLWHTKQCFFSSINLLLH